LFVNWHACATLYIIFATFIIGVYTNIKFKLPSLLIGKTDGI
jgi:hypothetical protein